MRSANIVGNHVGQTRDRGAAAGISSDHPKRICRRHLAGTLEHQFGRAQIRRRPRGNGLVLEREVQVAEQSGKTDVIITGRQSESRQSGVRNLQDLDNALAA